jgi:hypothetical protein
LSIAALCAAMPAAGFIVGVGIIGEPPLNSRDWTGTSMVVVRTRGTMKPGEGGFATAPGSPVAGTGSSWETGRMVPGAAVAPAGPERTAGHSSATPGKSCIVCSPTTNGPPCGRKRTIMLILQVGPAVLSSQGSQTL